MSHYDGYGAGGGKKILSSDSNSFLPVFDLVVDLKDTDFFKQYSRQELSTFHLPQRIIPQRTQICHEFVALNHIEIMKKYEPRLIFDNYEDLKTLPYFPTQNEVNNIIEKLVDTNYRDKMVIIDYYPELVFSASLFLYYAVKILPLLEKIRASLEDEREWERVSTHLTEGGINFENRITNLIQVIDSSHQFDLFRSTGIQVGKIADLKSTRPIHVSIIHKICDMLNKKYVSNLAKVIQSVTDLDNFNNLLENSNYKNLVFILHVTTDGKQTYLYKDHPKLEFCHFTLLKFNVRRCHMAYIDILGLPLPTEVNRIIEDACFLTLGEMPIRYFCHYPAGTTVDKDGIQHTCTKDCEMLAPFQLFPANICGVVAAVFAAIECIAEPDRPYTALAILNEEYIFMASSSLVGRAEYFFRKVILMWLAKNEIDLAMLQTDAHSKLDFSLYVPMMDKEAVQPSIPKVRSPVVQPATSKAGSPVIEPATSNVGSPLIKPATSNMGSPVIEPAKSNVGSPVIESTKSNVGSPVTEPAKSNVGSPFIQSSPSSVGSPVQHSISRLGSPSDLDNLTALSRNELLQIKIPQTRASHTINIIPEDLIIPSKSVLPVITMKDIPRIQYIPPENVISQFITTNVNNRHAKKSFVQLDYCYIHYSVFICLLNFFKAKEIQTQVLKEQQWFQSHNFPQPPGPLESIPMGHISLFSDMIRHQSEHKLMPFSGLTLTVGEITDLACARWLNNSLIMAFCKLINDQSLPNICCLFLDDEPDEDIFTIFDRNFLTQPNVRIILLVHVQYCVQTNQTIIGRKNGHDANHYATAVYDTSINTVTYMDTFAIPIPNKVVQLFNRTSSHYKKPNPKIFNAHNPKATQLIKTGLKHTCRGNGCASYPIQTCSNICGVASIITSAIEAFDFPKKGKINFSNLEYMYMHKNISTYSTFLRMVLISWFVSNTVNIDLLKDNGKQNNSNLQQSPPHKKSKLGPKTNSSTSRANTNQQNSQRTQTFTPTYTNATQRKHNKPTVRGGFTNNSNIATIHINTQTNQSNSTNNNNNNPDLVTNTARHTIPNSQSKAPTQTKNSKTQMKKKESLFKSLKLDIGHIRKYLVKDPYIRYDEKKNKYVLSLHTVHGCTKTKSFQDLNSISLFLVSEGIRDYVNEPGRNKSKNTDFNSFICESLRPKCPNIKSARVNFCNGKAILLTTFEDGVQKSKSFPGVSNQNEFLAEIINFMNSESFLTFNNTKWNRVLTIPQGNETLYKVEQKCPFDFRKEFIFCRCHAKDISFTRERNTLFISCTENNKWGKTHRLNDTFKVENDCDPHVFVTINITCASNTSECRSVCGALLSSLTYDDDVCSNCSEVLKKCFNCKSYSKPDYEEYDSRTYCQSCYMYLISTGSEKPIAKYENRTPQRSNHLQCRWALKLELHSSNQSEFTLFEHYANSSFHQNLPMPEEKRLTCTQRDRIDSARAVASATPLKIYSSEFGAEKLRYGDKGNDDDVTLKQIAQRCRTVDSHYVMRGNCASGPTKTKSDWYNAEKILENNFKEVLLFQRGNMDVNREYVVILCPEFANEILSEQKLIGYDCKWNFNQARFGTNIVVFPDKSGQGRIGAVNISNSDEHIVHKCTLQFLTANAPCRDKNCQHPKELYIFNDGMGFFHIRPCTITNKSTFSPVVEHDKSSSVKCAMCDQNLPSCSCNYHISEAVNEKFSKCSSSIKQLSEPLMLAFKSVLHSWSKPVRLSLIEKFNQYISDIPGELLTQLDKEEIKNYFREYWFDTSQGWENCITAEIIYNLPPEERLNKLVLTNNMTERKFREIVEMDMNSFTNKSLARLYRKIFTERFPLEKKRYSKNTSSPCKLKPDEKIKIKKGIKLFDNQLVKPLKGWEKHGWFLVFKDNRPNELDDANSDLETSEDIFGQDHEYALGSNASNIIRMLKDDAINLFKRQLIEEIAKHRIVIPYELKELSIVNIYLLICSCPVFACRGQLHPCKHIAASICFTYNTNEENAINTILASTPPALTKYYPSQPVNFEPATQNFDLVEKYLEISHIANDDERESAAEGSILKPLDADDIIRPDNDLLGRPARDITNRPYRRKKEKENRKRKRESLGVIDCYRPNIEFRKNVKDSVLGKKRLSSHPRKNIGAEYETNIKLLDLDIEERLSGSINIEDYKAKVFKAGLAKKIANKLKKNKKNKKNSLSHCFYCRKLVDPKVSIDCSICKKKFHLDCSKRCSFGGLSKKPFICKWCRSYKVSSIKGKLKRKINKRRQKKL